jgi:hypothetical protein
MNENRYPPYSLLQCLDRLSPRARAKYDDLQGRVSDAEALQRSQQERIRATEEKLARIANRRDTTSDAAEAARLDRELAAVRSDLDKLERERAKRNAARANTEQIVSRINNAIGELFSGASDVTVPAWPGAIPGPAATESIGEALLRLRDEIARARGALVAVQTAPLPASEIKAAIAAAVDRLAAAGAPHISSAAGKVTVQWPDQMAYAAPGAALSAPSGSASALACWLHGGEIKKRLCAAVSDSKGAIPAAERPGRIKEIEARIFALELGEERLVCKALDAGMEVHRRPDCSPFAILYAGIEEAVHAVAAE